MKGDGWVGLELEEDYVWVSVNPNPKAILSGLSRALDNDNKKYGLTVFF